MSEQPRHLSTGKDDWMTPRHVLDWLDKEFAFDLDAAADIGSEAFPGRPYIAPGWWDDGYQGTSTPEAIGSLSTKWWLVECHHNSPDPRLIRSVWLNPPYSRAAGGMDAWQQKAWAESRHGITVVVLCPPSLDRVWAQRWVWRADELRIFRHRLRFVDPATGQPAPNNTHGSMLTIYRPHVPEQGWPGGPRISFVECREPKP